MSRTPAKHMARIEQWVLSGRGWLNGFQCITGTELYLNSYQDISNVSTRATLDTFRVSWVQDKHEYGLKFKIHPDTHRWTCIRSFARPADKFERAWNRAMGVVRKCKARNT